MENKKLQETVSSLILNRGSFEEAEQLLLDYVKENPTDVDGWAKLVMLETLAPIEDYERATEYLNTAIIYHKDNQLFHVLRYYFTEWFLGGLDEELVNTAFELKSTFTGEVSSMLSYILARHFQNKDMNKFESFLKKSIQECSMHVTNYTDLGRHYLSKGDKEEGIALIREGLLNVKVIYNDTNMDFDSLDIVRFVNEMITGVFMTEDIYRSLEKLV
ncbi:tetratricopeptide repeat protein [Paenibacillus kribbensis]|uniref:tetratricopeptide repeat protein n=1 Tax=Paenibacillus kribbensis TaxID=172713 RepID=UPI0015BDD8AE|nr:hypothetical protein [Paenibacillus kribbensis]